MNKETIGGQAVIEGVMMRSSKKIVTAVRNPKGKIEYKQEKISSLKDKYKVLGLPFIRGVIILFEILILGIKSLNYSMDVALKEEKKEKTSILQLIFIIILSVGFALFIFKFLPLFIVQFITKYVNLNTVSFNILDGVFKTFIFIGYCYVISLMSDVKEVFKYHGAEHKAVYCYENNEKLTVKNAKKYSTLHARCGTSFIFIVIILSIIVYMFIPQAFSFGSKLVLRIILLPLIAGISYEVLKISAKYHKNIFFRILTFPGTALQKITTKEPNDKQIEVAIFSLKKVLR